MYDARKVSERTILVGEDYSQGISFEDQLFGRTITAVSATAVNADTGETDTAIAPDGPTFLGPIVSIRLVGAQRGRAYRVYVFATLSTAEKIGHLLQIECV
jgi:hypothetical protein